MNPALKPSPLPAELRHVAEQRLQQFAEAANKSGIPASNSQEWPGDTLRAWACSEFVANSCIRRPTLVSDLLETSDLTSTKSPDTFRRELELDLTKPDSEPALMQALRLRRHREMVRIAWRDLAGLAGLDETVADTSAFADAAVDTALKRLHDWACERFGVPLGEVTGTPQSLIVIGMGKLGAEELNFSSDIDLVFAYPENGETQGARRTVSNTEFFAHLGRRLISVLGSPTAEGFVFRVDMRLRPFGTSGPLVISFDALEHYYQAHGRDWERYAFIRARTVAGNAVQGAELLERLKPFVYRRYLDFGAIESLREMKSLIDQEVHKKGLSDNIKLGPGGIREVEFLGQAFQMIRGGQELDLRERRILTVLERLGRRGHLPQQAVEDLTDAYRFLRNTEHRLQQVDDRQVHTLPKEPKARLRLAVGMGFPDWPKFSQALEAHRGRVQAQFDEVFAAPEEAETSSGLDVQALWPAALSPADAQEALRRAGFDDPEVAWEQVQNLGNAPSLRSLGKRGRQRMDRLIPLALQGAAGSHTPTVTLVRLLQVIQAIAKRSVYLALLVEHPVALAQLTRLCEASPWITQQIGRYPLLLDDLLDPRTLYSPAQREELEADLRARLANLEPGDTEGEMDALRRFKQSSVLRIAAADVSKAMPLMVVSDHLTAIAEVTLRQVLRLSLRDAVERYGHPRCSVRGESREPGFIVVGYGKLGGIELGYSSDLDLVFLHGSTGLKQFTDGERSVDNGVFFGRLGQRIIHFLSARTAAGLLYEVDSRLRPSGASGLLVSSIDAFEEYQRGSAWTWEHQALVRARVVAGDTELRTRFEEIRAAVLLQNRDPERLRQEVSDMRSRMHAELAVRKPGFFDLKQGRGGIADIEFMVQYGTLAWASRLGEFLKYTDNIRLLDGFAHTGLIPKEETDLLATAYRAYRARVHALALQEKEAIVDDNTFSDHREGVSRVWQDLMGKN